MQGPALVVACFAIGLPGCSIAEDDREVYHKCSFLIGKINHELSALPQMHDDIQGDRELRASLLEFLNVAAAMRPSDSDDIKDYQLQVWTYLKNDAEQMLEAGLPDNWRSSKVEHKYEKYHFLKAMLRGIAATLPPCRMMPSCVTSNLQLSLWGFANANANDPFAEGTIGRHMFDSLKQFLPSSAQWRTPWQCPSRLHQRLEARPVWKFEDLPEGSTAHRLIKALRAHAAEIKQDLLEGVLSKEGKAFIHSPAWTGLHHNGEWDAFRLYSTPSVEEERFAPRQLDPLRCRITPTTCRILREVGAPAGLFQGLPSLQFKQEVVDFLRADPGTVVVFHAASTNSRLSIQLCLTGCDDDRSYIQAGPERIFWRTGEPLIFDDSFLHSVKIHEDIKEPRWVLLIQMMYPALDSVDQFVAHFAGEEAHVADEREGEAPVRGGTPPQPLKRQTDGYTKEQLSFHNGLNESVALYAALWGPDADGPRVSLGVASPVSARPYDDGVGMILPPLAHRTRLSAVSLNNGEEIGVWWIDAREESMKPDLSLPVKEEEFHRRVFAGREAREVGDRKMEELELLKAKLQSREVDTFRL